jgi:hypothetical protein
MYHISQNIHTKLKTIFNLDSAFLHLIIYNDNNYNYNYRDDGYDKNDGNDGDIYKINNITSLSYHKNIILYNISWNGGIHNNSEDISKNFLFNACINYNVYKIHINKNTYTNTIYCYGYIYSKRMIAILTIQKYYRKYRKDKKWRRIGLKLHEIISPHLGNPQLSGTKRRLMELLESD